MPNVRWQIQTLPRAEAVPDQEVTQRLDDQELRELRAGQVHEVNDISVVITQIERDADDVVISARRLPDREQVSQR